MLIKEKFTASKRAQDENFIGAVATAATGYPKDISAAVSIKKIEAKAQTVSYRIAVYEEPEDVADPDSGDFLPGIEATPHSDWSFSAVLLTEDELQGALAELQGVDFYFRIPVPELDLTLLGFGHTG